MRSHYSRCDWGLKVKLVRLYKNNEAPFTSVCFQTHGKLHRKCVSEMLQMCIVFLLSLHVKGSPSVENAPKTAVMHHAPQKSSGASLGRLLLIGLPYAWRVKTPKTNTCWNVSLPMWRFERGLTLPPMYLCNDGHTLYDLCAFSFWICRNCGIEDTPEWSVQFVSGQTGPCTT